MSFDGLCSRHRDALASYRCRGCGEWLCLDCVEVDDSRFLAGAARCRNCGEPAAALEDALAEEAATDGDDDDHRQRSRRPTKTAETPAAPMPDIVYTPAPRPAAADLAAAFGPSTHGRDVTPPFLLFAHHVVVPAATITMVTALYFFLLELRTVYFGDSDTLRWLGFWFVTATVLIARYGKMSTYDTERDRQGCYTLALAFAMVCVLLASPWEDAGAGATARLVNSAIFLAVWRFATRLTAGLSLEGEEWWPDEPRLYGLERLAAEELARQRQDRSILRLRRSRPAPPQTAAGRRRAAPGNPSVAVARLALLALLVFALSEPLLLRAPPSVGERGAASMILFLFATGVVLGAASSVAGYRRARSAGSRASVGVIPGRLAAAAGLMAVILAIALTLPGVDIRGTGELRPRTSPPVTDDSSRSDSSSDDAAEAERRGRWQSSPAASLLELLSRLGRLLRIPFVIAVLALAGFGIWRLWPLLADFRKRLRSGLGGLGDRLRQLLDGWLGGRRPPAPRPADPLADLDSLHRLPPREAVLGAYGRLLSYFDQAGFPRPRRQTPHEFLGVARRRFRGVAGPLARLTEAYVEAAYGRDEIDAQRRREVIAALVELVSKGPLTLRGPDAPYPSGREGETVA